jgi:hypothetical protein
MPKIGFYKDLENCVQKQAETRNINKCVQQQSRMLAGEIAGQMSFSFY